MWCAVYTTAKAPPTKRSRWGSRATSTKRHHDATREIAGGGFGVRKMHDSVRSDVEDLVARSATNCGGFAARIANALRPLTLRGASAPLRGVIDRLGRRFHEGAARVRLRGGAKIMIINVESGNGMRARTFGRLAATRRACPGSDARGCFERFGLRIAKAVTSMIGGGWSGRRPRRRREGHGATGVLGLEAGVVCEISVRCGWRPGRLSEFGHVKVSGTSPGVFP